MDCLYQLSYQNIAGKIKSARKFADLTQAELAEKINISTNAVAKLENNLMAPSLQTLINIANVLNIDLNYLLRDEKIAVKEEAQTDLLLDTLIHRLSPREKEFIIHVIKGMELYYSSDK